MSLLLIRKILYVPQTYVRISYSKQLEIPKRVAQHCCYFIYLQWRFSIIVVLSIISTQLDVFEWCLSIYRAHYCNNMTCLFQVSITIKSNWLLRIYRRPLQGFISISIILWEKMAQSLESFFPELFYSVCLEFSNCFVHNHCYRLNVFLLCARYSFADDSFSAHFKCVTSVHNNADNQKNLM